jgi:hypothetical protein
VYDPPGAIPPEFQVLPTDVCVVLSWLVHVTLPPTATVTGLGAKAVVVRSDPPLTIDTGVPLPAPLPGLDGVVGVEYVDPQPEQARSKAAASAMRIVMMASCREEAQHACRVARAEFRDLLTIATWLSYWNSERFRCR